MKLLVTKGQYLEYKQLIDNLGSPIIRAKVKGSMFSVFKMCALIPEGTAERMSIDTDIDLRGTTYKEWNDIVPLENMKESDPAKVFYLAKGGQNAT